MKPPILKGKGFMLRPFERGDESSLRTHINSKDVERYTLRIPNPYSMQDAQAFISKVLKRYNSKRQVPLNFAIGIGNDVVGGIGLNDAKVEHKIIIGYWLSKKYWGRGIMTEAVKRVTKYVLGTLGKKRLVGYVFVENEASAKVLEKAGFTYDGTLHAERIKNGRYRDEYIFAKIQ